MRALPMGRVASPSMSTQTNLSKLISFIPPKSGAKETTRLSEAILRSVSMRDRYASDSTLTPRRQLEGTGIFSNNCTRVSGRLVRIRNTFVSSAWMTSMAALRCSSVISACPKSPSGLTNTMPFLVSWRGVYSNPSLKPGLKPSLKRLVSERLDWFSAMTCA